MTYQNKKPRKQIKAFVFDMDGTTVDTINSIKYFGNKALEARNLGSLDASQYMRFLGEGAAVLVERMINAVGGSKEDYGFVYEMYNRTYNDNFLYLTKAYDGVIEAIASLRERGIKIAILSNKPENTAIQVSDELFGELVDICHGGRDGYPLKPSPVPLTDLLSELGVSPDEAVMVGDTATDIKTGKNAGVFSIAVTWGFRSESELIEQNPDALIHEPRELLSFL
jgi:phosphoglycolate phosphatase